MSRFIVGLTGGVGSGKSTVAELFVEKGIGLVDTDAIAHELTGPDGAAISALVAEFGPAVLNGQRGLDRSAMRRMVFADSSARGRLEGILHPLICQRSTERCRAAISPYVILAVPLLVESAAFRRCCNRIVTVDCPESLQIERVMARSALSADEVKAIIAAQAIRAERLAVADDVVLNDGALDALNQQINTLHQKYLRFSAEIPNASC